MDTMQRFNQACNWISDYAFEHRLFSRSKLHKAVYYQVRADFDFPAQLTIRAINKVIDAYKLDKATKRTFKERGAIEYDCNNLNWKNLETVSIGCLNGRLNIPIVFGKHSKLKDQVLRKSADLVYRKGTFYLQAIIDKPEKTLKQPKKFLGVDMGITNLATTSANINYSGEQVDQVRIRTNALRGRLQSVGTKSAKKHLKRLSGKERRFKRNTNHIISKQIVEYTSRHRMGIALENLSKIRKTVSKAERDRFGKWSFYELCRFIEYKAALAGIPIIKVDPSYTSQTCSECGHCEKANRKGETFRCRECGYEIHADFNASINIANRALNAKKLVEGLIQLLTWAPVNEPIVAIEKQPPVSKEISSPQKTGTTKCSRMSDKSITA